MTTDDRTLRLTGPQMDQLQAAMLSAFDTDDLEEMLLYKLNRQLNQIVSPNEKLSTIVREIIRTANLEGWMSDLLQKLQQERPQRLDLQQTLGGLLISVAPPIIDPLPPAFDKNDLVKALLACGAFRNRKTRDSIVEELPQEIRTTITRFEVDKSDAMSIVSRCMDFSGGIGTLVDTVRFFEGDSVPMQRVDSVARSR